MSMNVITDSSGIERIDMQQTSNGTLAFADDVLTRITEIAASEIDGVSSMKTSIVEKENSNVTVSISAILDYQPSLLEIAMKIQEVTKSALQIMTGLTVMAVNVSIRSLNIPTLEKQTSA